MTWKILYAGSDTGRRIEAPNRDLALSEARNTVPVLNWHQLSVERDEQDIGR